MEILRENKNKKKGFILLYIKSYCKVIYIEIL